MAKKVATKSKTQLLKDQKALTARIKRANDAIRGILTEAGLMLVTPTVRIFFEGPDGSRVGGDVIKCDTLARMCNLPMGTVIMPQVSIRAKPAPPQ